MFNHDAIACLQDALTVAVHCFKHQHHTFKEVDICDTEVLMSKSAACRQIHQVVLSMATEGNQLSVGVTVSLPTSLLPGHTVCAICK